MTDPRTERTSTRDRMRRGEVPHFGHLRTFFAELLRVFTAEYRWRDAWSDRNLDTMPSSWISLHERINHERWDPQGTPSSLLDARYPHDAPHRWEWRDP